MWVSGETPRWFFIRFRRHPGECRPHRNRHGESAVAGDEVVHRGAGRNADCGGAVLESLLFSCDSLYTSCGELFPVHASARA